MSDEILLNIMFCFFSDSSKFILIRGVPACVEKRGGNRSGHGLNNGSGRKERQFGWGNQ